MGNSVFYTADRIFDGERFLEGQAVEVRNGTIVTLKSLSDIPSTEIRDFKKAILAPAYMDLQIYGAAGRLLAVYPDSRSIIKLVEHCANGGTAFCLPTVATNEKATFFKCIDAVRRYIDSGGTGIPGIHLEGPWLNAARRGAHVASLIHRPTVEEVSEMLDYGKGVIRMITLAPEVCSDAIIDLIHSAGVVISAGHSDASYEQSMHAFSCGVKCATHLFNAMSPLHHRQPGLPGAIMNDERIACSIIPDGYHVDYTVIRLAKKNMEERLFAITDAVTDTSEGYYRHELLDDKYVASGVLSGSALTMNQAMKNLVNHCRIELPEALRMCSLYPARVIGMDNEFGKIAAGYLCKLIVLDQQLDIKATLF